MHLPTAGRRARCDHGGDTHPEPQAVAALLPVRPRSGAEDTREDACAGARAQGAIDPTRGERRRCADPDVLAVERGRHRADVPRRGAAAHSGCRDRGCVDPRQDRARRLALACGTARNRCSSNAACWGLVVTGKLVAAPPDSGVLGRALSESLGRVGEPVIRAAMRAAMRFLGEQFVLGETIEAAIERARAVRVAGLPLFVRHARRGRADGRRREALRACVHDRAPCDRARCRAPRRSVDGPGLSVKLSAPHYRADSRAQRDRVTTSCCRERPRWRAWRASTTSASTSLVRRPPWPPTPISRASRTAATSPRSRRPAARRSVSTSRPR